MDSWTSWLFLMPGIQKHLGFMITLVWFGYGSTHDIQALLLSQYRVLINECAAHPNWALIKSYVNLHIVDTVAKTNNSTLTYIHS